ncbi:MAG: hydantoin utilization protein A [Planctomycetota bacterium]
MFIALEGALAGLAHVVSGPDHLAGVAPLAADGRARRAAALVGAQWGLGHGFGVLLLGAAGQAALSLAQVEAASGWAERLVGLVLIGLGVVAVRRSRTVVVHRHARAAGDTDALHAHLHPHPPNVGHRRGAAALGMGFLHGLAGAGHLWAVVPSLALRGVDAALYLASYLIASVVAMIVFGYSLAGLIQRFGARAVPRLLATAGSLSIAVGVYWTWSAWAA